MPGIDPIAHAKQTKLPPAVGPTEFDIPKALAEINAQGGEWQDKGAAYLTAAGWIPEGQNRLGQTMWRDPWGENREVREEVIELPNREGGPTYVKQKVCPPASWSHTLAQALGIQHIRDSQVPEVRLARLRIQHRHLGEEIRKIEEQLGLSSTEVA